MVTREQTDARIEELRANKNLTDDIRQGLIDEALTIEADQLTHGNNMAIIHAFIFGMCLVGFLAVL
jgi:hypothetical protein